MRPGEYLTQKDAEAVNSFRNFLYLAGFPSDQERRWSPATWAYLFGFTNYCPPEGTL